MTVVDPTAPVTAPGQLVEERTRPAGLRTKRIFDLVAGILLSLVLTPVIALLAAALLVRYRTNPFFFHQRIGPNGPITIPKLRTLTVSHHPFADKTEGLQSAGQFAARLRRTHLDELPQIYLVPLGTMSLVGPRPRMQSEADTVVDPEFDRIRLEVPQGCTGLWQVSVGQAERVSDHPEYDRFYVEHRSLAMDIWILWRTVIQAMGASPVDLDDVPVR